MKFTSIPFDFTLLHRDAEGRPTGSAATHRGAGLHLSEILRYIGNTIGLTDYDDGPIAAEDQARVSLGFVWERALSEYLYFGADAVVRPDEITLDGIHLNPDAVQTVQGVLLESKLTWRSMRRLNEVLSGQVGWEAKDGFPLWLWQILAYCKATGTSRALLVIFFVNGDYRRGEVSGKPQPRVVEFEFTKEEIERNWQMVVRHGAALTRERGRKRG